MNRDQDRFPIERDWKNRLQYFSGGPCVPAPEIIELAEKGKRCPDYGQRMDHIVLCASCREALAAVQSNLELEKRLAAAGRRFRFPWLLRSTGKERWIAATVCGLMAAAGVLIWLGRPIATLKDGEQRIALNRMGRLDGLPSLPPQLESSLVQALKTGRLETPAGLAYLRPPRGVVRTAPKFWTHGPVATRIASRQPEFAWKLPAEAAGCMITLSRIDAGGHILERKRFDMNKTDPKAERWTPKKSLLPGSVYTWQMAAYDRTKRVIGLAPAQPDMARFQVLGTEQAENIARQARALNHSHLALVVFYSREGLMDDAERHILALQKSNPASPIVQALERSLQVARRPDA